MSRLAGLEEALLDTMAEGRPLPLEEEEAAATEKMEGWSPLLGTSGSKTELPEFWLLVTALRGGRMNWERLLCTPA